MALTAPLPSWLLRAHDIQVPGRLRPLSPPVFHYLRLHQPAAVMLQVWPTLNADARLLLLDEPAAGLDIAQQVALDQLIALLTAAGLSVLMCAHDINHTLQHADEVWLMAQGELVAAGTAAEVMTPDVLAKVFTVSFSQVSAGGRRWLMPCGE